MTDNDDNNHLNDLTHKDDIQVDDYTEYPFICSKATIEWAIKYQPVPKDRFVVTYPKSGTSWTQQIISLITTGGQPSANHYFDRYFIERVGKMLDNNLAQDFSHTSDGLRVIKTHLPRPVLPYNPSSRYLLVFRNPKDVCVSHYYMWQWFANNFDIIESKTFDDFFNFWINGHLDDMHHGRPNYFVFVRQYWLWANDTNQTNVKFIFYEQMHRNLKDNILTIAEFLGSDYKSRLLAEGGRQLDLVVKHCNIQSMKTSYENDCHLRKGIVGDWRSLLSRKQSDIIDRRVRECWADTDLASVWTHELKWCN